jgi:LmbE family N-acetylglucosaminyl deacetylase
MVIVAHPDDAEFGVAGTIALWARAGCRVTYVICTDGNAGSHEPGMTRKALAKIRRREQQAACDLLGVANLVFLGHDDGQLQATLQLRRDLVQQIRKYKPEVVIAWDPTRLLVSDQYINHPDHRAAGLAALDAAFPACKMPLLWPELGPGHPVRQVYVRGASEPNKWVDIGSTIDIKINALRQHESQLGDWDPTDRIKNWAAEAAKEQELEYAEAFRVITLERDH